MQISRVIIFLSCLSVCFVSINACANANNSGIEVVGNASVLVEPNTFALSITVSEEGRFTNKIRNIVDHKSNQVINIAKRLGIESSNINSARVTLRVIKQKPEINIRGLEVSQKLPNNKESDIFVETPELNNVTKIKPQYFEISRNITINFENIKDYDLFLNAIIKIGVNHISPLTMSVNDTDKYYKQALMLAIEKAKEKAVMIAEQSKQKLGKLIYLKETSNNYYRAHYSNSVRASKSYSQHNSNIGTQSINASVSVKYAIE